MTARTIGERRYARFADEWDDPFDADGPRWFTAVYTGDGRGPSGPERRWRVDGVDRCTYGEGELVIGDLAAEPITRPILATRDRTATRPRNAPLPD